MGKKNEHMFCKGDGLSFGGQHVHYAKGYCFNEYQKARYRAKHPKPEIPPVPRICKGDGKLFNTDTHRHYAKGYCFAEYRKMRYQKQKAAKPKIPPMPRICKGCKLPFNSTHKHHANGYCSAEYHKIRYQNMETGNTSNYRGVSWSRSAGKWQAQINRRYDKRHLGYFDDEYDAACAYDAAVIRYDIGAVNFPQNFQLRRKKS